MRDLNKTSLGLDLVRLGVAMASWLIYGFETFLAVMLVLLFSLVIELSIIERAKRRIKHLTTIVNNTEDHQLNALGLKIAKINKANGWRPKGRFSWQNEFAIPASLARIHSEVSEALEAYREDNIIAFSEELADIIIRTLDCSEALDIDIDKEINKKLVKNQSRSHRHGGKRL